MRIKMKRLLGILLSLALVLGLMPGMNLTAYAATETYTKLMNDKTVVKFNNHDWYIIADDSTNTGGTLTLLAADTSFGNSAFQTDDSVNPPNDYSKSVVKAKLDALTEEGGAFESVKDAIADTNLGDVGVTGAKLYLLSTSEAGPYVDLYFDGADFGCWWLRSPGESDNRAAFVLGEYNQIYEYGPDVTEEFGVRPALKLDLSKVVFDSSAKTFGVPYPLWVGGTQVTSANASNIDGNNNASYDVTSNTLTLNGYTYSGDGYSFNGNSSAGVYYNGTESLNLVISGTNSITNGNSNGNQYGIYSTKDVAISGSGKITVCANNGSDCRGIYCNTSALSINSGTVIGEGKIVGICGDYGVTINGGSVEGKGQYGISGIDYSEYGYKLTIGENVTSVIAKGTVKATDLPIVNAINGTGWTDVDGTEGKYDIGISENGQSITYKKVQFPAHTHSFTTYTATGATITATCSEDDCPLTNKQATLTIAKPALTTYGDSESAEAQITDTDSIKGDSSIVYKKGDETLASAPTGAGTYTASITLGTATASVEYTIAQKEVTISGITASDKVYDGNTDATLVTTAATVTGKLDGDALTVSATGIFDNANVGENKTVMISGLTLDGTSKDNYKLAATGQQATTNAKITAKEVSLTWSDTELAYTGEAQKPTATATGVVDGDTCTVTVSGEQTNVGENYTATADSLSNSNYKLPENKTTTFKIVKANAVPATVTANNRTYDGTEKPLVTVDNSTLFGGEMQYALGTDATTAPTSGYEASIPTKTDAGTYYVWYKVKGDDNHNDTEPNVRTVTIDEEIFVRYYSNGGSGNMSEQKVEKNIGTELKTNAFTREGYSFKEWNTKENGSGTSFADKAEVTLEVSLDLYAQWEESKDHNHLPLKEVSEVEPKCEEDGNKHYYKCETCGKIFEDALGQVELTRDEVILKAIGHKWDDGEITKEATYDEEGVRTYTCSVCGETKTESIKKKERPSSYDDSDDSSSDDSDSGSSSSSGSSSKRYTEAQAKVDQINNVSTYSIPENHQVESGVPASDIGGRWGNNANANTWTYTKSDGTLAKSEWMSLDYNGLRYWYYFNEDGNMQTNWFDYNNERFYLMPEKDGWLGRMATGWKNIENKWYYFDIVPGSSQGRLYRSTVTPDGHTVGADGAWNGVGATPVGQK